MDFGHTLKDYLHNSFISPPSQPSSRFNEKIYRGDDLLTFQDHKFITQPSDDIKDLNKFWDWTDRIFYPITPGYLNLLSARHPGPELTISDLMSFVDFAELAKWRERHCSIEYPIPMPICEKVSAQALLFPPPYDPTPLPHVPFAGPPVAAAGAPSSTSGLYALLHSPYPQYPQRPEVETPVDVACREVGAEVTDLMMQVDNELRRVLLEVQRQVLQEAIVNILGFPSVDGFRDIVMKAAREAMGTRLEVAEQAESSVEAGGKQRGDGRCKDNIMPATGYGKQVWEELVRRIVILDGMKRKAQLERFRQTVRVRLDALSWSQLVDSLEEVLCVRQRDGLNEYLVTFDDGATFRACWVTETKLFYLLVGRRHTYDSQHTLVLHGNRNDLDSSSTSTESSYSGSPPGALPTSPKNACATTTFSPPLPPSSRPLCDGASSSSSSSSDPSCSSASLCAGPSPTSSLLSHSPVCCTSLHASFQSLVSNPPLRGPFCHFCRRRLPNMLGCTYTKAVPGRNLLWSDGTTSHDPSSTGERNEEFYTESRKVLTQKSNAEENKEKSAGRSEPIDVEQEEKHIDKGASLPEETQEIAKTEGVARQQKRKVDYDSDEREETDTTAVSATSSSLPMPFTNSIASVTCSPMLPTSPLGASGGWEMAGGDDGIERKGNCKKRRTDEVLVGASETVNSGMLSAGTVGTLFDAPRIGGKAPRSSWVGGEVRKQPRRRQGEENVEVGSDKTKQQAAEVDCPLLQRKIDTSPEEPELQITSPAKAPRLPQSSEPAERAVENGEGKKPSMSGVMHEAKSCQDPPLRRHRTCSTDDCSFTKGYTPPSCCRMYCVDCICSHFYDVYSLNSPAATTASRRKFNQKSSGLSCLQPSCPACQGRCGCERHHTVERFRSLEALFNKLDQSSVSLYCVESPGEEIPWESFLQMAESQLSCLSNPSLRHAYQAKDPLPVLIEQQKLKRAGLINEYDVPSPGISSGGRSSVVSPTYSLSSDSSSSMRRRGVGKQAGKSEQKLIRRSRTANRCSETGGAAKGDVRASILSLGEAKRKAGETRKRNREEVLSEEGETSEVSEKKPRMVDEAAKSELATLLVQELAKLNEEARECDKLYAAYSQWETESAIDSHRVLRRTQQVSPLASFFEKRLGNKLRYKDTLSSCSTPSPSCALSSPLSSPTFSPLPAPPMASPFSPTATGQPQLPSVSQA